MSRREWESGRRGVGDADSAGGGERGQLVLVSGGVVAVALLALVVIHAQLAYAGAAAGAGGEPSTPSVLDLSASTHRAVEASTAAVAGRYDWVARDAAAAEFRADLDPQLTRIERAHTGAAGVSLSTNDSAAAGWALRNCPDGPSREFGDCVVDDGVVFQERAGETVVVAVAVDVRVATPRSETDLTLAVRPA